MEELTIGEVAGQAGIRASAIRYYESVKVLPAPRRTNGRRLYDSSVLDTYVIKEGRGAIHCPLVNR